MRLDYSTVWRWHFYGGLFLAPVLVFLAVTGSIYLFDEEIDAALHGELHEAEPGPGTATPAEQVRAARDRRPGAELQTFRPAPAPDRTSRVGLGTADGRTVTVFVDPHDASVVGSLVEAETFTEVVRDLHEKFLAGTAGNWVVEAAASWMIVLLLTGLYLWWPRGRSVRGTLVPRLGRGGRTFWRDLHAVTGSWLAILLLFQGLAGLAWTDVWGDAVKAVATSAGVGFPEGDPFNRPEGTPESTVPTAAVADDDLPWAAGRLPVPASRAGPRPGGAASASGEPATLALADVARIAEEHGVPGGYTIHVPEGETGVFTVTRSGGRPQGNATLHVDRYSGEVLADLRFEDYGFVAQAISVGIMIHQGDYFGWPNKALVLGVATGLILMLASAVVMWWRRRPDGRLGAPPSDDDVELPGWLPAVVVLLGVLFPLFGATLLLVLALDRTVVRRIPALERRLRG